MIPVSIVVFLALLTGAVLFILRKKSGETLTQVYLASITIKLLLSGGFVTWFILYDQDHANYNVVFFLVAYVIFTAAEVIFLLVKKRA